MAKTFKTYGDKLKDPRWQQRRLEILNRDKFTCQQCQDKKSELHVHHLWYNDKTKLPWDVESEALLTLCKSCHKYLESIDDGFSPVKIFKTVVSDSYALLRVFGFFGEYAAIVIARHDFSDDSITEVECANNIVLMYAHEYLKKKENGWQ